MPVVSNVTDRSTTLTNQFRVSHRTPLKVAVGRAENCAAAVGWPGWRDPVYQPMLLEYGLQQVKEPPQSEPKPQSGSRFGKARSSASAHSPVAIWARYSHMTFPSSVQSTSYPERESRPINDATSCGTTRLTCRSATCCMCATAPNDLAEGGFINLQPHRFHLVVCIILWALGQWWWGSHGRRHCRCKLSSRS